MSFFVLPIQIEPNTGFGQGALATGQGARNVALGNSALAQITNTGEDNIGIGYRSGRFLTTQDGNVLVGSSTMENATGITNIALGLNALRGVVSVNQSSNNVAIGNDSLFQAQGTNQSTAVGSSTLRTNTGDSNTALGYGAGYSNFRGTGNTFIGASSGFFFQSNAVLGEVTGNTFIGESSGISITDGKKNTIIGRYSGNQGGLDIRTLSNYIVISDGDGNPRIWVDNTGLVNFPGGAVLPGGTANGVLYLNASGVVTSGTALVFTGTNLGIGTSSPAVALHLGAGRSFQIGSTTDYVRLTQPNTNLFGFLLGPLGDYGLYMDSLRGNLGLGVAPSAWAASARALDFAYPSVAMDTTGSAVLGFNAYNSSGITWNYKSTDEAALFTITTAGAFTWRQAVSGTAGNAISFTQAMTLDASGNLFIGGTAGAEKLNLIANTATSGLEKGFAVSNDVDSNCFISITGTAATDKRAVIGPTSATALVLQTNGSARARIPSAGGMVIGTAAIATNATDGFLYVAGCAGTPTGIPTAYTGRVPIVIDTTNNKLYFYSGGAWRDAGP